MIFCGKRIDMSTWWNSVVCDPKKKHLGTIVLLGIMIY